jgi:hypothetical protein
VVVDDPGVEIVAVAVAVHDHDHDQDHVHDETALVEFGDPRGREAW